MINKKVYYAARKTAYITLGNLNRLLPFWKNETFVICYHSISDDGWDFGISKEVFKKQINYLAKRYSFVSLAQIAKHIRNGKTLQKPSVAITFDDGYEDVLQIKNFIKSKNIKPTIFVLSDRVNANRTELDTKRGFMTKKDILSLLEDGWEVGSHTATHSDMYKLTNTQIKKEIIDSKKSLEMELDVPIKYIAYPKGRYTKNILKAVETAGYEMAMAVDDKPINPKSDFRKVPRIGLDRSHNFAEFKVIGTPMVGKFRNLMRSFGYGF